MGTTSNESLRYPGLSDDVDVPGDIQNLAEDTDTRLALRKGRGLMATPITTSTDATVVTSGEVKETLIGDYVFTAVASRRYKVTLACRVGLATGQSVPVTASVILRDGGASSPTTSSSQIGAPFRVRLEGSGGQNHESATIIFTFTPTAGTHTIGVFLEKTSGTGNPGLVSLRELYVEDIGAA